MKKKIIIFHLLNNFTGSPQVLRNVIENLNPDEYEIELYTSLTRGFLSDIQGVHYQSNYYFRSKYKLVTLFSFFFSQFLIFLKILFLNFKDNKPVFYVNTILPFSAILVGKFKRIPVITHVHEYFVTPKILNTFLFYITNNFSTKIIIVSNFLKINHVNSKAETLVIYNALSSNFNKYNILKDRSGSDLSFCVLMLASLRPYKGISDFISLAILNLDINFNLVLSDSQETVDKYFSSIYLPMNLKIFPSQRDVTPFYLEADLVINLSNKNLWIETFGMTILEAMNFGIPVIVPTIGGITELVEDGINGFLIDSNDHNEISAKINLLKNDFYFWKKLSQNSFKISKDFSFEIFKRKINKVILESYYR